MNKWKTYYSMEEKSKKKIYAWLIWIFDLIAWILFQWKLSQISVYYTSQAIRDVMLSKDPSFTMVHSINKRIETENGIGWEDYLKVI